MMTLRDQVEFTNAQLRPLVYKQNRTLRGTVTDPDALLLKRARHHLRKAQKGAWQLDGSRKSFPSILARWDNDEKYRKTAERQEGLTREDAVEYDRLANLPRVERQMDWQERVERNKHHAWKVVQEKGGGGSTVQTRSYPTYHSLHAAKASAPAPYQPSSSSTSWNRGDQWWSNSWQANTPPWKHDDKWEQKKW